MESAQIMQVLIGLVIVVLGFFLLRELFCWYNKTNERLVLEKERNELLKKIVEKLSEKQ